MINIHWTKFEQKSICSFYFRGITLSLDQDETGYNFLMG